MRYGADGPPLHLIVTSGLSVLDRGQLPANVIAVIRKPYTEAQVFGRVARNSLATILRPVRR